MATLGPLLVEHYDVIEAARSLSKVARLVGIDDFAYCQQPLDRLWTAIEQLEAAEEKAGVR